MPDLGVKQLSYFAVGICLALSTTSALARSRHHAWYLSPGEFTAMRASGQWTVVDIRPSDRYRAVRIPGSVNLSLRFLSVTQSLKRRPVLLVNEGHEYSELEAAYPGLVTAGFTKVRILEGGLNAWAAAGLPIEGSPTAKAKLKFVSARELELESAFGDQIIVDISPAGAGELRTALPQSRHVSFDGNADFWLARLKAISPEGASVVLADSDGTGYARIEHALKGRLPGWLFFLDGGAQAVSQRKNQDRLLAQSRKVTKRPGVSCAGGSP